MVKLSQQATVVALAAALPVLTSTYKFRMLDSVILALAGALAVYNVNCLTRGNCNAWATLVAVSFFVTTLLQFKNYEGQEPAYTKYTKLTEFTLDLTSLRNMLTDITTDFNSYVTKYFNSVYNYMVELYNNIIDYDKILGLIGDATSLVTDIKDKVIEIANESYNCATGNQKNEIIATNEKTPAKKSTINSSAVSLSKPVALSNSVPTTVPADVPTTVPADVPFFFPSVVDDYFIDIISNPTPRPAPTLAPPQTPPPASDFLPGLSSGGGIGGWWVF
jgi:hypothetical protein